MDVPPKAFCQLVFNFSNQKPSTEVAAALETREHSLHTHISWRCSSVEVVCDVAARFSLKDAAMHRIPPPECIEFQLLRNLSLCFFRLLNYVLIYRRLPPPSFVQNILSRRLVHAGKSVRFKQRAMRWSTAKLTLLPDLFFDLSLV